MRCVEKESKKRKANKVVFYGMVTRVSSSAFDWVAKRTRANEG